MPVSDFECQIARGQIGRYLDGGVLSPQALTGLEEHLAECPGCKAAVAERRAALLGTLGVPTHAAVSMPVENPLVAALRARAEDEPVASKAEIAATSEPVAKASPRYAKAGKVVKNEKPAPAKNSLAKPLALAALLAVVLLSMGRFSHLATAPTARASTAFAAESLPESSPTVTPAKKSGATPAASVVKDKKVTAPSPSVAEPRKGDAPTGPEMPVAIAPKAKKAGTTAAAPTKPKSPPKTAAWGDLFRSNSKLNPDAREAAPNPKGPTAPRTRVTKPKSVVAKPKIRAARPKAVRVRLRSAVRRVVRIVRRPKPVHHASRTTVRVYGLDGRPLKP